MDIYGPVIITTSMVIFMWLWINTYENTTFKGLFTSINPSYFDVNYRGTRFCTDEALWRCVTDGSAAVRGGSRPLAVTIVGEKERQCQVHFVYIYI